MRVVTISDTVSHHENIVLPQGDVLLHTGDVTMRGSLGELEKFLDWFRSRDFLYKIFIAGDHDTILDYSTQGEKTFELLGELFKSYHVNEAEGSVSYLEDNGKNIWGVNFFGSPYTSSPYYGVGTAFKRRKGKELFKALCPIPKGVDVLMTHEAPRYTCDFDTDLNSYLGSAELRLINKIRRPKVNVFGHIKDGYGINSDSDTLYVNGASYCHLHPTRPVVFDIDEETKKVTMDEFIYPINTIADGDYLS